MKEKYIAYEYKHTDSDGNLLRRFFIALADENGILHFTDYDKYCRSTTNSLRHITSTREARVKFVVPLLNYLFFYEGIASLDDMTVDMVKKFFNAYGRGELPWDDEYSQRSEATVKRCVDYVMDFLILFIEDHKRCRIKPKDLYRTIDARDKYGRMVKNKKKVPVFDVYYKGSRKSILRDIPNAAFDIMFSHMMQYHPELLGVAMLGSFVGLRPSEACNVRRADSPLGAGIIFTEIDGTVIDISIDLTKELNLRSDLIPVGGIKKERMQQVCPLFRRVFMQAYTFYMEWLEKQPCEEDYKPFSINSNGKAMTYDVYYQKFTSMVRNELIPVFLGSEEPDVVLFGHALQEHNLGPHAFRHWFTVQLVLSGITDPGTIQHWRGDRNPLSAIDYLNNKGEIEKMYQKINNETFDYLYWRAQKKFAND